MNDVLTQVCSRMLRYKVMLLAILALVVAYIVAYIWISTPWYNALRTPSMVRYCVKSPPRAPGEAITDDSPCFEYQTLKIPVAYYGVLAWANNKPDAAFQRLEAAYPSMQPWSTQSRLEKRNAQKIEIALGPITPHRVRTTYENHMSSPDKPRHLEAIYGMDQYLLYPSGAQYVRFYPLESNPRAMFRCGYSSDPALADKGLCIGNSYMDWNLALEYIFPRTLLPEWRSLDDKVHALIQSFVIIP
jgi:hypothetical protein